MRQPVIGLSKPRIVHNRMFRAGWTTSWKSRRPGERDLRYTVCQCAGAAGAPWSLIFFMRNMKGIMARKVRPRSQKLSM